MEIRTATKQVQVPLVEWEELAKLGRQRGVPPMDLMREALRQYLAEKNYVNVAQQRRSLQHSFGVWRERRDLKRNSVDLVNEWRNEWHGRAQRLGMG